MARRLLPLFALLFAAVPWALADDTPSADALMRAAFDRAKAEGKAVVLSFHASWCGWCHRLEDFLKKPEVKAVWDKRVVTVWLTVLESPDHKKDENAGGADWLTKLGGNGEGIPYTVVFDAKGKALTDSRRDGKAKGNIGYPAAPEEIAWFMAMLEKGVPGMTPSERELIKKALQEEAKKLGR